MNSMFTMSLNRAVLTSASAWCRQEQISLTFRADRSTPLLKQNVEFGSCKRSREIAQLYTDARMFLGKIIDSQVVRVHSSCWQPEGLHRGPNG